MINMKKIYLMIFAVLLFAGCQQKLVDDLNYRVSLADGNTFVAGQPVTFQIDGDVDNLLFFSGEDGHQYKYRNRTSIDDMSLVNKASLSLELQGRYGYRAWEKGDKTATVNDEQLFIYVLKTGKTFAGLTGNDKEADMALLESLEAEGGLDDWERIPYTDMKEYEQKYSPALEVDLKEHLDNFVIAFHWVPKNDDNKYRWWWFKGLMNIDIQGFEKTERTLPQFGFTFYMKNVDNPYAVSNVTGPNGSIILGSAAADIQFRGGKVENYTPEVWAFSTPMSLNKVDKDTGVVIKYIQNYLPTYSYTFDKPGTYEVTFVGSNVSINSEAHDVQTVKVTILPDTADLPEVPDTPDISNPELN